MMSSTLLFVVLSLIAAVVAQDDPTPIQQRIAFLPNGMTVSWSTLGPIAATPSVVYGLTPGNLTATATGWSAHYDPSVTYFHHVMLTDLTPSTRYYWRVTSPSTVNSSTLSFTTAPVVGSHAPFTVSINGDMGLVNEDSTVATMKQWVSEDKIDFFWHVGDLAYADDWQDLKSTYEKVQETWMSTMTGIWDQKAYMMCPGNHEATCDESTPRICPVGQRNFTSYRQRYHMPAKESGAVNNMWWSIDYAQVHMISIDTEVDYPHSPEGPGTSMNGGPFGDQLAWLEADLKKAVANRAQVPWILVAGHRPYYSSSGKSGVWDASRPAFEPLFLKYDVDIVYWGHVHWYERYWPTGANGVAQQKSYVDAQAPIYLISASVGNVEGLTRGNITQDYTAFLDDHHFGLGLLQVQNATHLNWTFYESDNQQVLDHVMIVKTKRWEQLQATKASSVEELAVKSE